MESDLGTSTWTEETTKLDTSYNYDYGRPPAVDNFITVLILFFFSFACFLLYGILYGKKMRSVASIFLILGIISFLATIFSFAIALVFST